MAEIDPDGCECLPIYKGISSERELRTDQPDTNEYRQFLGVARGSNCELQTQLEIVRKLGMGDSKLLEEVEGLSHEVGKMIFGVLRAIKDKGSVN